MPGVTDETRNIIPMNRVAPGNRAMASACAGGSARRRGITYQRAASARRTKARVNWRLKMTNVSMGVLSGGSSLDGGAQQIRQALDFAGVSWVRLKGRR